MHPIGICKKIFWEKVSFLQTNIYKKCFIRTFSSQSLGEGCVVLCQRVIRIHSREGIFREMLSVTAIVYHAEAEVADTGKAGLAYFLTQGEVGKLRSFYFVLLVLG